MLSNTQKNWLAVCQFPDAPPGPSIEGDLPDGIVGTAITFNYVGSNGQPPYTFTIVDGELPAGLNMDSNGNITGTFE